MAKCEASYVVTTCCALPASRACRCNPGLSNPFAFLSMSQYLPAHFITRCEVLNSRLSGFWYHVVHALPRCVVLYFMLLIVAHYRHVAGFLVQLSPTHCCQIL